MEEIVASVKRVTEIMGEINYASQEQTIGIERINRASIGPDDAPQKNAALVKKAAAAAVSMQDKATALSRVVSIFNIGAEMKMTGLPTPILEPEQQFDAKCALSHRFSNV